MKLNHIVIQIDGSGVTPGAGFTPLSFLMPPVEGALQYEPSEQKQSEFKLKTVHTKLQIWDKTCLQYKFMAWYLHVQPLWSMQFSLNKTKRLSLKAGNNSGNQNPFHNIWKAWYPNHNMTTPIALLQFTFTVLNTSLHYQSM